MIGAAVCILGFCVSVLAIEVAETGRRAGRLERHVMLLAEGTENLLHHIDVLSGRVEELEEEASRKEERE